MSSGVNSQLMAPILHSFFQGRSLGGDRPNLAAVTYRAEPAGKDVSTSP